MKKKAVISFVKKSLGLIIPLSFLLGVLAFVPFGKVFEYEIDEGIYLMRAYMYDRGYELYKDIWMDQPPMLVLMLAAVFKIFGASVYAARILMLTLSTLLIWALYQIISRTQNILSALSAVVLVIFCSLYIRLSVTAMGPIPSIAMALLSIYGIFLYYGSYKKRFLLLSGALFAIAILSRFFALVFLPGILCEIAAIEKKRTAGKNFTAGLARAYSLWGAAFLVVFLYIAFVATSMDFSQLWQPYVLSRNIQDSTGESITRWFSVEWNAVLMAIAALIFLKREDRKFFLIPLMTFVFGMFIFFTHRPIWFHHRLYILIPMCWLASFGVYALCKEIGAQWENRHKTLHVRSVIAISLLSIPLILTIAILPLKLDLIKRQTCTTLPDYKHVVSIMKKYSKQTHLVVTDRPIYTFYAGMPVPPYLVSSSAKRVFLAMLTEEVYLDVISKEKPELIIFARYPDLKDKIAPYLEKDYELEFEDPIAGQWLYVLKSIKEEPLRD